MCCTQLAENTGHKKIAILAPSDNCRAVSSQLRHVSTIGKKLHRYVLHMSTCRLQRIQHSLARVVTHRRSRALPSATALLKQLRWLPVEWRIRFKLATMTFKALHTGRPTYLTDQLQYYQPTMQVSALIGFSPTCKATS